LREVFDGMPIHPVGNASWQEVAREEKSYR